MLNFPGRFTIQRTTIHIFRSLNVIKKLKKNGDVLKIIQFGLTLCDAQKTFRIWGPNSGIYGNSIFWDFDVDKDLQNPKSIELLQGQGIDFLKDKQRGICSHQFARLFTLSRLSLALNSMWLDRNMRTWVTSNRTYNYGFLVKILIQQELLHNLLDFVMLMRVHFGITVYYMKQVIGFVAIRRPRMGGNEFKG
ncbi:putative CCR4-associated factor [Abeliophyllum distichum]|uniref:CCR4-associated factor n=1 Tax=Abeliophyllum distichum TaxID=126358 RepID=A0ABD1VYR2_9LAMI